MGDLSTPELGKLVERLRDSEKFATGMTRDVLTEAATAIEALEQAVDAFADICDELGCERDNEAGLIAADSLKARTSAAERERDELKAEVERLREALKPFAALSETANFVGGKDLKVGGPDILKALDRARSALKDTSP